MKKYCCHNCADSPFCAFCEDAEETILHMFWECPKVQDFWIEIQGWLQKHFEHCTNVTFSKELIILGVRANLVTDRITDSVLPSITPNILARPM